MFKNIVLCMLAVFSFSPVHSQAALILLGGCVWDIPNNMIFIPEFSAYREHQVGSGGVQKSIYLKYKPDYDGGDIPCQEKIGNMCFDEKSTSNGNVLTLSSMDGRTFVGLKGFTSDELKNMYIGSCYW